VVAILDRYRERRHRRFMERRVAQVIELLRPDRERIRRVAFVDGLLDLYADSFESIFGFWLCVHQFEVVRERWHRWTHEGRSEDWIAQFLDALRDVPRCELGCHDIEEVFPDA
jgi:hypothetical protein